MNTIEENNKRHYEALAMVENWESKRGNKVERLGGVIKGRPIHNVASPKNPSMSKK
ncbi:MAG: hypothetical protein GY928_16265 [Colwellia sp.]|nr:hypothetical protein [Colwellia sp.]